MATAEESPDVNKSPLVRLRSNSYDRAVTGEQSELKTPLPDSTPKTPPPDPTPKTPSSDPTPTKPPENRHQDDDIYVIKWIEFNQEQLLILLQNINGPCPLLALANVLLLRKQILLPSHAHVITTERVIATIANYILQMDSSRLSSDLLANYEHNVEDALAVLPRLKTGIDVNLQFHRVDKFEFTRECIIFDLLNIQLFHGWVIDPQDTELRAIIHSNASSYNQLVEKMIHQKHSKEENLARESLLIEQFLEDNRSQLTHYGILQLNETMRDNQLAVLFRNNHFSTIWKNNKQLLLLVSDQGYMDHPLIVFETLMDVDNDSVFTDGYGRIWRKPTPVDSARDRDLAIAVHNDERRRLHEAQLRQQQQPQGYYQERSSRKSKKKSQKSPRDYDDDSGCIVS